MSIYLLQDFKGKVVPQPNLKLKHKLKDEDLKFSEPPIDSNATYTLSAVIVKLVHAPTVLQPTFSVQ